MLDRLTLLVRLGLGGRISTGRQWVTWIHVRDMLRARQFVVANAVEGVVNLRSPNPVQNETLMKELQKALEQTLGTTGAGAIGQGSGLVDGLRSGDRIDREKMPTNALDGSGI